MELKTVTRAAEQATIKVATAQAEVEATEQVIEGHRATLDGAPEQVDVDQALAAIAAAAEALSAAAEDARRARVALSAAQTARGKLDSAEKQARAQLNKTRDTLAPLAPPALPGEELAGDWRTLLD